MTAMIDPGTVLSCAVIAGVLGTVAWGAYGQARDDLVEHFDRQRPTTPLDDVPRADEPWLWTSDEIDTARAAGWLVDTVVAADPGGLCLAGLPAAPAAEGVQPR